MNETLIEELEVLLISSQKSPRMMFPKGGWETDESMNEAVLRETVEEAGVAGIVGYKLGTWSFKSKSQGINHEGHMFPLLVTDEFDVWPEKNVRQRIWMSTEEAREACTDLWMREALDAFVCDVMRTQIKEDENCTPCSLVFLRKEEPQKMGIVNQCSDEEVECCLVS
jgi:diphosphoinositol-polyphosphate diphosphatase